MARISGIDDISYTHSHGTTVLPYGMTCLHYDWKARKEMNADGSLFWQRWDPWQLLSCLQGSGTLDGPFVPAQNPAGITGGHVRGTSQRQGSNRGWLTRPGGRQRCPDKVCGLFNRAPAGCHYGEKCIYAHRCHSEDNGRWNCPSLNAEEDRSGQFRHTKYRTACS